MSQIGVQKRRIEDIESAKYITGALRDISAIELKGLRNKFERNTMFYAELKNLYQIILRIREQAGNNPIPKERRNNTLYVAYTTNRHFYGSLNNDVIKKLVESTGTKDKCLIVGDTGKQIWHARAQKRREISFMSFEGDSPDAEETNTFLQKVAPYTHVFVFYPSFVSVFEQKADMIDITFRPEHDDSVSMEGPLPTDEPQYLLEPDLTEMLSFFNTQVRYALVEQVLLETDLSRVAARLVKMDTADQNANKLIGAERKELRRAFSSFSSRRMLETLVGYLQWHKQKAHTIVR